MLSRSPPEIALSGGNPGREARPQHNQPLNIQMDMTGLSRSNLHYMLSFADVWPHEEGSEEIVQQPVGQMRFRTISLLSAACLSMPQPGSDSIVRAIPGRA
jgi:hypothetical protein